MTEDQKNMGTLSVLPREIRDEIYRSVLPKAYKAFWSLSVLEPAPYNWPHPPPFHRRVANRLLQGLPREKRRQRQRKIEERNEAHLAVLRLSKDVHAEATALLYLEGTFSFGYRVGPNMFSSLPEYLNETLTRRMTNIQFVCDVGDRDGEADTGELRLEWVPTTYLYARAGPLKSFLGVTTARKSTLVELRLWEWSSRATEITESPLISALKQFTGFRTVEVRLAARTTTDYNYPLQATSKEVLARWVADEQWAKLYARLEPLLSAIGRLLEPTLGSSGAMSPLKSGTDDVSPFGYRCIVFHPSIGSPEKEHGQYAAVRERESSS